MKIQRLIPLLCLSLMPLALFATAMGSVEIDGLKYTYIVTDTEEYVNVRAVDKTITEAFVHSYVTIKNVRRQVTRGYQLFNGCADLKKVSFAEDISIDLGSTAFSGCAALEEITLPKGVKAIGTRGFWRCYNLEKVVFENPDAELDERVFEECTSLTSVSLPQNITKIHKGMFHGCTALKQITLGNRVETICAYAFWQCKSLEQITLPQSVKSIEMYAFANCPNLRELVLPSNLESIGGYAFSGNRINELEIPASVRQLEEYSLSGVNSAILWPKLNDYSLFAKLGLGVGCVLYTHSAEIDIIRKSNVSIYYALYPIELFPEFRLYELTSYLGRICFKVEPLQTNKSLAIYFNGNKVSANADGEYWLTDLFPDSLYTLNCNVGGENRVIYVATETPDITFYGEKSDLPDAFLCGFKFYSREYIDEETGEVVKPGTDKFTSPSKTGVMVREVGKSDFITCTADKNGYIFATGLDPDTEYEWCNWGEYNGKKCVIPYKWGNLKTLKPEIKAELVGQTQTTISFQVSASSDESGSPKEKGMIKNVDGEKYAMNESGIVVVDNLIPNNTYWLTPYAVYNSKQIMGGGINFYQTKSLNLQVVAFPIAPSSVTIRGAYTSADAPVSRSEIILNGAVIDGNVGVFTSLDPETSYSATFNVYCNNNESEQLVESKKCSFTTPKLSIVTLPPKVISAGNIIVGAESNLADEETNVGFEWRRTDWTDDFDSKSGAAYLFSGDMEGYIRNLNTEKLWKFRPYYESDTGKRYYGDWKGIDPTDVSFFEPTIHTYAEIAVDGNTAQVKGYVQRGTDNVVSQGFAYWKETDHAEGRPYRAPGIPGTAKKVEADGTVMKTLLTDLDYESTYHYVAFATTNEGETYFGEELSFTTGEDMTNVKDVMTDQPVVCEGVYDTSGRRLTNVQKGLNIIRFSDGTTKKVYVK